MENLFINDLMQAILDEEISTEVMSKIKNKLLGIVSSYHITKREYNLTTKEYNSHPVEIIEYLASLKVSGLSPKTLLNYELELRLFYQSHNISIRLVTHSDILKYLYECQSKNKISDVTMEHKRIVIHSFYKWMHLEGYVDLDPSARIKPIKCIKRIQEPLTNLELEQMRLASSCLRDLCLVEVLYSSGMRVSEVCSVNRSAIDFNNKRTTILGKGNKERIIRFSDRALLLIKQYLNSRDDDNDALFVTARKPFNRLTKAGIEYIVHKIAQSADINRINVTPHTFRRNHGLAIYNKTNDIYKAAASLGHSNISTTTKYIKLSHESIQQTFDYVMN